jgi:hypothetical protein
MSSVNCERSSQEGCHFYAEIIMKNFRQAPSFVPSEMVGHIKIPPVLENDVVEEVRVLCDMCPRF